MSKKLLINNYSENGLMPVMDGLVCWLDGRDSDFIDRTGNFNFEVNNIISDGKKFVFNGVDSIAKFIGDIPININNCTVNFIFRVLKDNLTYRVITIKNSIIALDSSTKPRQALSCTFCGIDKVKNMNKIENYCFVGDLNTTSTNRLKSYYDDICYPTKFYLNGYDSNPSNSIVIGGRLDNKQCTQMELCSIKIYNRALTEEEIQQNYLYEQSIERGE